MGTARGVGEFGAPDRKTSAVGSFLLWRARLFQARAESMRSKAETW
jgi:hypothetical protein